MSEAIQISAIYEKVNNTSIKLNEVNLGKFLEQISTDKAFIETAKEKIRKYVAEVNSRGFKVDNLIRGGAIESQIEIAIREAKKALTGDSKLLSGIVIPEATPELPTVIGVTQSSQERVNALLKTNVGQRINGYSNGGGIAGRMKNAGA